MIRHHVVRAPLMALIAILFLGVFLNSAPLAAQDATPAVSTAGVAVTELAPGVTAEVFAGVPSDRAPGQTQ